MSSTQGTLRSVIVCAGPPIDFSFMELSSIMEIENEEPRGGVRKRAPNSPPPAAKVF